MNKGKHLCRQGFGISEVIKSPTLISPCGLLNSHFPPLNPFYNLPHDARAGRFQIDVLLVTNISGKFSVASANCI